MQDAGIEHHIIYFCSRFRLIYFSLSPRAILIYLLITKQEALFSCTKGWQSCFFQLPSHQHPWPDYLYMQSHFRLWHLKHSPGSPSSQPLNRHLLAPNAFACSLVIAALAHHTLEPVVLFLDETPRRGHTQMACSYCALPLLPSSRPLLAEQLL